MRKNSGVLAAIVLSLSLASAPSIAAEAASKSVPLSELTFNATGVTDGLHGELKAAPAYGDLSVGAHGTFIRMPAGFVSKVHTHTEDYWGVVISGVAVNGLPGSADIPLPVGSYWFQKGGEAHVTKCIAAQDCLFFISQNGKFDYVIK